MRSLPDKMLGMLAQRYLRAQAETLAGHLDGAKAGTDIEDVHQVRVACRRLRAGLTFFGDCFDDDKADRWREQLKKMLKRFGPARDCDVHIIFLQNTLKASDKWDNKRRPGVARLLLRLEQKRDKLQQGVVKAVRRIQRERLTMNLHLETERLLYEVAHADEQVERIRFYDRAGERVDARLAEVLEKRSSLDDPTDKAGHHALRIAVKKLRYTLELCDTALDGRLRKCIKRLKQLQTLLGDLHDCDMWDAEIEAFIVEETERIGVYYGHTRPMRRFVTGLRSLQALCKDRRQELFAETAACAAELESNDFWNWIRQAVREDADLPCDADQADDEGDVNGGQ